MKTNLKPKEDLVERVKMYTKTPFYIDRGPRRDLIISDLQYDKGVDMFTDVYGNVWCKKGEGRPLVIVSSHMDTVFGLNKRNYSINIRETESGTKIRGTLDNSLGCVINTEIIKRVEPNCEVWSIFSVSEEPIGCSYGYADEEPIQGDYGLRGLSGAQGVCDTFRAMQIKPDLCIALDVTYPDYSNKKTLVCAENFSSKGLVKLFKKFNFENGLHPFVKARGMAEMDESWTYRREHPAFALGPVVYGSMHGISGTYLESLTTTTRFLEKVLTNPGFIKKAAEQDKRDRNKRRGYSNFFSFYRTY
jgi:putative aminopeptidase FrvX